MLTWSAWVSKTQPVDNKAVISQAATQTATAVIPEKPVTTSIAKTATPPTLLAIKRHNLEIFFDEAHAAINKVVFQGEREHTFPLQYGFLTDDGSLKYVKSASNPESIIFVAQDGSKKLTKTFTFSNSSNIITLQIKIQNISSSPLTVNFPLLLGTLDLSGQNPQARYQDVFLVTTEKSSHLSVAKMFHAEKVKVLGFRDQYFCLLAEPPDATYGAFIKKLDNNTSEVGLESPMINLAPGAQIGHLFQIYVGPQDLKTLNAINPSWAGIIYFGTFDIISQVLLQGLQFLYNIFHSWGWAIIVLSILVYLILYPLSVKQMRSMKEMQAIQPKVEALRKLYKDNPQKMNKEIMELYKLHKVNPFGGCLPLLLQMPIFFALYNALMRSISLRGAKFLWIQDLSEPDRLFTLPVTLPILGNEFNILPIVMALGMFFQQKITATSGSGAAAEQQKMMLIIMPIMFGLIFYRMPSGLVLYWLINSMLMLVFQLRMSRAK